MHEGSAATVDLAAISGGFAIVALDVLHEYACGPKSLQAPELAAIGTVSLRNFMHNPGKVS